MKIVSWNIARRREPWQSLLYTGADFALRHPSIDEISAEIPSEQKNREAADRGALCREVGDDVTTEYGPDRLDA